MIKNDMRGVPSIVAGVAAMAIGDAMIKRFAARLPLDWLIAGRSAIAVLILLGLYTLFRRSSYGERADLSWATTRMITLRSTLLAVMWLCYYAALPHIALSLAAALFYTSPIFICLMSTFVGVESWSYRRALSIALGSIGVLVALQPWHAGISSFALLPLGAAVLYAAAQLLTRTRLQNTDSTTLAAAMNGALLIAAGIVIYSPLSLSLGEQHIDSSHAMLWNGVTVSKLAILAILISITAKLTAQAFQKGLPTIIGIFDYAYLIFATALGWLLFSEIPTFNQWVGILLIVMAGVLLLPRPGLHVRLRQYRHRSFDRPKSIEGRQ